MRIVPISDTHCQHGVLTLPPGDVLLHAGDWTHRGEEDLVIKFLVWLSQQPYKHKLFVAGNHDFYPQRWPVEFRALVKQYAPDCIYLEDESVTIEGYKFHGSPISLFFHNWAFGRYPGDDIQKHWDKIPDDTDVLITHTPIHGLGDVLARFSSDPGKNAGCSQLRHTIEDRLKNLKLHVGGHIHEGAGTYQLGSVTSINAAVLDERYRMRYGGLTFDLPNKNADSTG